MNSSFDSIDGGVEFDASIWLDVIDAGLAEPRLPPEPKIVVDEPVMFKISWRAQRVFAFEQ